VNAVVQAYRQARDREESKLTAFNAAADAALALGRSLDKINDTARVLIDWTLKTKRNWSRIYSWRLACRKRETACASRLWEEKPAHAGTDFPTPSNSVQARKLQPHKRRAFLTL